MPDYAFPTTEIETPADHHKVVLKQFITGYDDEAIEAIYTSGKHKVEAGDPENPRKAKQELEFDGSVIQQAEREGIKRVVLSVDGDIGQGNENGLLDLVYNMKKEDARFVKTEVDKIVNPPELNPKKKES